MSDYENPSTSPSYTPGKTIHWPSVLQLGLSLLGTLTLWGIAAMLFLGGFVQQYLQGGPPEEMLQYFLLSGSAVLCGALLLPSSLHAFRRLAGLPSKPVMRFPAWLRPSVLIFSLPLLLLFGYWINTQRQIAWLILPPIHVLTVGLPILWFVYLATRDLSTSSPQRQWGVFGTGLVVAPTLSFFIEIFIALALVLIWSLWVATQPDLMRELTNLAQRLEQAQISPEEVLRILEPYITKPAVIIAIVGFFAVLVPLVEETMKSLGVWLLVSRNLSPADGFVAGVLSGAGFALAESLALTSTGGDWAITVLTRLGTGTIHILASGLVGWGLARAWGARKYLQMVVSYLLAVFLHAIWNTLSILLAMSYLPDVLSDLGVTQASKFQAEVIPYVLVMQALIGFLSLLWINRTLKPKINTQVTPSDVV